MARESSADERSNNGQAPAGVAVKMTRKEKLKYFMDNVTVEPMLGSYIVPSVLAGLATQNLNLEKACRVNLEYGDEICDALTRRETEKYQHEEMEVQALVARMLIWRTLLQSALPAFLIMFLGAWSDRTGRRKPCMLMPIVGEFASSIGLIVCTYFFYELPMEAAGLVEGLFPALSGGWMTMFMAIYSYMGDVTTLENRTLRIGFVNVFCSVGIPIGTALSGVLYREIGFYGVFSLSAALYVFSFSYGLLRIEESPRPESTIDNKCVVQDKLAEKTIPTWIPGIETQSPKKKKNCILHFFDIQHVQDTFRVAFKDGPNNRKKRVIFLMIVVMVVIGPMQGEMAVSYLFTRYKFNWNEVDYSMYSTYSMVTNLIGTLFSVGVFSHMMKIDDALIGIMSCMSKILAGFVYAFATTTWVFYLAPLVDIVNGTSIIAMRSIASKLVPPEELGKVNSLFGVCEALMPLVYGPMYSTVYAYTMNTMPGAFFLLGGALTIPAVVIFAWMYTEHKKDEVLERLQKENQIKKEKEAKMNEPIKMDVVSPTLLQTPPITNKNGCENSAFVMEDDCSR